MGILGVLLKLKTGAEDSVPFLPFMLLRLMQVVLLGICFLCDNYSSCLSWENSGMARAGAYY